MQERLDNVRDVLVEDYGMCPADALILMRGNMETVAHMHANDFTDDAVAAALWMTADAQVRCRL